MGAPDLRRRLTASDRSENENEQEFPTQPAEDMLDLPNNPHDSVSFPSVMPETHYLDNFTLEQVQGNLALEMHLMGKEPRMKKNIFWGLGIATVMVIIICI